MVRTFEEQCEGSLSRSRCLTDFSVQQRRTIVVRASKDHKGICKDVGISPVREVEVAGLGLDQLQLYNT